MSVAVWPPLPEDRLCEEEANSLVSLKHIQRVFFWCSPLHTRPSNTGKNWARFQASELRWLLDHLHENFASLKNGLEECFTLLLPQEPGSTLALSSVRSESIKGHVTRLGAWIVKGVSEKIRSSLILIFSVYIWLSLSICALPPPTPNRTSNYVYDLFPHRRALRLTRFASKNLSSSLSCRKSSSSWVNASILSKWAWQRAIPITGLLLLVNLAYWQIPLTMRGMFWKAAKRLWVEGGGRITYNRLYVCNAPPIHQNRTIQEHQTHYWDDFFFHPPMLAWGSSERIDPLLHRRRGAGSNPTHPHARTGRTVFSIHYRVHLAPTRIFTRTTTPRWSRSDVWVGGGSSHGSGEGQGRESGSELHFAYDKVERLGAWNSGWQIVIGGGYGICIT